MMAGKEEENKRLITNVIKGVKISKRGSTELRTLNALVM